MFIFCTEHKICHNTPILAETFIKQLQQIFLFFNFPPIFKGYKELVHSHAPQHL